MKRALKFEWSSNIAVIEEEKNKEYIVYQYCIDDGMKLTVSKNPEPEADPKWILSRGDNGKVLKGKKTSYPERNEKNRKQFE